MISHKLGVYVVDIGSWIAIRNLTNLPSLYLCKLLDTAIKGYCCEEGVNHGVRVSLSAFDPETTVEETSLEKHLPNDWMTPIIWSHLRVYLNTEIVMSCF